MIGVLFLQQVKSVGRYFRRKSVARSITVLAFVLLLVGLASGIYALMLEALRYIASFSFAGPVSLYIYELLFLTLMGLMVASALISGMLRLFQGTYDAPIMASPSFPSLPRYVSMTIFLSSLWPILLIGLPALLAMNTVFHLSIVSFVLALLSLGLLGVYTVAGALAFLLLATWGMYACGIKRLASGLVIAIIAAFAIGAYIFWGELRTASNISVLFPGIDSGATATGTDAIIRAFHFLPSHPAAEVFFDVQLGTIAATLRALLEVFAIAVASVLVFLLSTAAYLRLWQAMQEHSPQAQSATRNKPVRTFSSSMNPLAVLFEKEYLTFFRDQKNLLWLGFLGLLWLLQIGFDVIIKRELFSVSGGFSSLALSVQLLQVVVIVYFISMFVLRFVFPAFSIEKNTAWLIATIPVSLERIYLAKLGFYSALFVTIAAFVVLVHALILGLSLATALLLFVLVACMTVSIVLFGLSLGVLFPDFETNDAEELSTSLPGLVFIASALAYGSLGAIAYGSLLGHTVLPLVAFIAISIGICAFFFLLSLHALRRFDFSF